jgi:fused signal recognition particle receptor
MLRLFRSKSDKQADKAEEQPPQATAPQTADQDAAGAKPKKEGWLAKLRAGLTQTREKLSSQLTGLFKRGGNIDASFYEELQDVLLSADVGVATSERLIAELKASVKRDKLTDPTQLKDALKGALLRLLQPLEQPLDLERAKPFVIMVAGVNGAGKTTSIGKLAKYFQSQGKSVLLGAGDTFRAAACEQLEIWGERNNVTVISQRDGDPAAVVFDAIAAAKARGIDVVIADTAGRLPTQLNLMEEIKKVRRVIAKADPGAPHEVLLVLDANTGQNAIAQVNAFHSAIEVSGLVVTKLDGTAKGGAIAGIAGVRPLPIRFIGVGEGIDDLRPFRAQDFVDALLD